MNLAIAQILMCLGLSGCAFVISPHKVQDTPSVRGTILDRGDPAPGVTVYLQKHSKEYCERTKLKATSGESGEFVILGQRKLEIVAVVGDRFTSLGLCIELNGELYHAWSGGRMGEPPSGMRINCSLERLHYPDFTGVKACSAEGWPNYAIKPIAEQALGSNRAISCRNGLLRR